MTWSLLQHLIAYTVVALAAAWVVWSMFLPRGLKARLKPRKASRHLPQPVARRRHS